MILQYIWHDCFVLTTGNATVVFDYWIDPTCNKDDMPAFIKNADKSKPLYIVVSHHHKDHYSKSIFKWADEFKTIKYILSRDTARHARHIINPESVYNGYKPDPANVVVIGPGETFSDEIIDIRAYGSTDIGNSYLVKISGSSVFHAGDFNAWIWKDESDESEIRDALNRFNAILNKIAEENPCIDLAMFPVDGRLGTDYFTGASIFVRAIKVSHFFPMHFSLGENEEKQAEYAAMASAVNYYANPDYGDYICLLSPYSCWAKGE